MLFWQEPRAGHLLAEQMTASGHVRLRVAGFHMQIRWEFGRSRYLICGGMTQPKGVLDTSDLLQIQKCPPRVSTCTCTLS